MIDKEKISEFLDKELADTDCFPVEVSVSPTNDVVIVIDSDTGVDIDFCTKLSHDFEEVFPRDEEDYSLEVGSAGLTAPMTVRRQWEKNLGNDVDVLTRDGRKFTATLVALSGDGVSATFERVQKVKPDGAKRPVVQTVAEEIPLARIRKATLHLEF